MSNRVLRALSALITTGLLFSIPSVVRADYSAATAINFLWDAPAGSQNKVGTWLIREIEVTATGDASYFAIIGNWTPPFYLGIQELSYRTGRTERVALFSAWDTYKENSCTTCSPESRESKGSLTRIKALGQGVAPGVFGYEGTGVNAFMNDFNWSVGDRVRAVINLRPVTSGTEISAALQKNDEPWRFFATYVYANNYYSLESGYSFIEDFGGRPHTVRAAEFRSSWGEHEDLGKVTRLTRVGGQRNETTNVHNPGHRILQKSKSGIWGEVGDARGDTAREWRSFDVEVEDSSLIPVEARIAALNLSGTDANQYQARYQKDATRFLELQTLARLKNPNGSGSMVEGQLLNIEGPRIESGNLSYQWKRNNLSIRGATGPQYRLTSADVETYIGVEVTVQLTTVGRTFSFEFGGAVLPKIRTEIRYKNCTELRKAFNGGVANSLKWVNKGAKLKQKPIVNSEVYDLNKALDRDKDGLVCER